MSMRLRIHVLRRENTIPIFVAAGVMLLLIVGAVIVVTNERSYQEAKLQQVDAQARTLAAAVTAALAFDDRKTAQEYLNTLRSAPDVQVAAVNDAKGELFASYSRDPQPIRHTGG